MEAVIYLSPSPCQTTRGKFGDSREATTDELSPAMNGCCGVVAAAEANIRPVTYHNNKKAIITADLLLCKGLCRGMIKWLPTSLRTTPMPSPVPR